MLQRADAETYGAEDDDDRDGSGEGEGHDLDDSSPDVSEDDKYLADGDWGQHVVEDSDFDDDNDSYNENKEDEEDEEDEAGDEDEDMHGDVHMEEDDDEQLGESSGVQNNPSGEGDVSDEL